MSWGQVIDGLAPVSGGAGRLNSGLDCIARRNTAASSMSARLLQLKKEV